jgi:hypothetical protein
VCRSPSNRTAKRLGFLATLDLPRLVHLETPSF